QSAGKVPTTVGSPVLHHHYFYRDSAVVTFPKASRDRKGTRIVGQNKAGRGCPPPIIFTYDKYLHSCTNSPPGLPGFFSTIFPDFSKILCLTTALDYRFLNEFDLS